MRIYGNAYELMSEVYRDIWEMGHIVQPHTMQNKVVKDDPNFVTKEVTNYSYCLLKMDKKDYLFLSDERSKNWVAEEFLERLNPLFENPGVAWTIRKDVWEPFLDDMGKFDYTYNERMVPYLQGVIDELAINPDSRQAIVAIWDPTKDTQNIGGKKRVPCSISYQFLIREGLVHIIYTQRSADVITHFGNDIMLTWLLKGFVAKKLNLKPGYLYHNIGSLHCYKQDWPTLKRCINDIKDNING